MGERAVTKRGRLGFCDCYVTESGRAVVVFPSVAGIDDQDFVRTAFNLIDELSVTVNGNTLEARDAGDFVDALIEMWKAGGDYAERARDLLRDLIRAGLGARRV